MKQDMAFSKNTYYRFLNEPRYSWQRFLTLLSARVAACFSSRTHKERVKCLVLDDSVIERNRSKQVELPSWIYNHVTHRMVKGFNMLTLGWTDGYSFVPVAFNMMASADPGKHIMRAVSGIDRRKSDYKRRQEAVCHKPDAAMAMIHNALKAGIEAGYILMDTWFTNEPFVNRIHHQIKCLLSQNPTPFYRGRLSSTQSAPYPSYVKLMSQTLVLYFIMKKRL